MPKVSSQPGTSALAESKIAITRITQLKAYLPQINGVLRQQGALIVLIIVIAFSFIRYDNFDTISLALLRWA